MVVHLLRKEMQDPPKQEQEAIKDEIRDLFKNSSWLYQLVADLGHELRTPISGIIGLNELLLASAQDKQQLQYLRATQTCSNALLMTINEVVDVARLDAGKLKLHFSSIRVSDILAECDRSLTSQAEAQRTTIERQIDSAVPDYLVLDANRIKQVLNILLSIYLRIAESGKILIKCEKTSSLNNAMIRFGCIMPPVPDFALADLFKPFAAMESIVPATQITNWLRLRLANRLVNFMSGRTSVQIESDGSFGAYFELPLENVPLAAASR
jgi:K+-sensing histidine kinase KdpD